MAIGRLQAALASATNEVTVAAANLNFDFTLIKCEAPKEYQAIGNVLSAKRKENAEFGSSHVLARQLGALFDGVCPSTPALLEAYGNRASEIAKSSSDSSKPFAETLFGDYTGIDGTSIWAAATSSRSALHIHLLACLLARVWSASEAIAIWVELVTERKKDIARKVDEGEPVPFALAAAVGQDISRSQLAALDNGARAWLRTADSVFYPKQKQLDLILKNLDLSIPGGPVVFPSVIQTWTIALETMNKLVSGIPQAVQDGTALLGLSAWHLYPDMSIYTSGFVEVKMEDSNIAEGGILSLGVSRRPNSSNSESGVHWSLSLSQLRHYGRPVTVTRGLETTTRLTWSQFRLVLYSALIEMLGLNDTDQQTLTQLLRFLLRSPNATKNLSEQFRRTFRLLRDGANAYANRKTGDKDLNHKLIELGRRRSREFLTTGNAAFEIPRSPALSVFNFGTFLLVFKDVDSAITYFRRVAQRLSDENTPADTFLIRHRIVQMQNDPTSRNETESQKRTTTLSNEAIWSNENVYLHRRPFSHHDSYAVITALPPLTQGETGSAPHHRWLPEHCGDISIPDNETSSQDVAIKFTLGEGFIQAARVEDTKRHIYFPVLGSPGATALFARRLPGNEHIFDFMPPIEDVKWCLDRDFLHPVRLLSELNNAFHDARDDVTKTLRVLGKADLVYGDIPDATIDPKVLTRPLISMFWAEKCKLGIIDHKIALSMIAYLETGMHDIDPELLKHAIAVSYADSLYVPSALIQDPYESLPIGQPRSFRRILGNIGKPGLTFLLPPQEPMMREIDTGSWRFDSYQHFDGTKSKSFQNTSMHLSFTNYHVPIFDGVRGAYDSQISFIESVISVQDKGKWIADVDPWPLIYIYQTEFGIDRGTIMAKLDTSRINTDVPKNQAPCQHKMNSYSGHDITAVDTWTELLDTPVGMFVVRTGDNWVSRLASALVAHQLMSKSAPDIPIMVCPPEVCWTCVRASIQKGVFIF